MTNEREFNLCTLVLEDCLKNKTKKEITPKEMNLINSALNAFTNLDFFDDNKLRRDFNTSFDNNSFPAVVDALFKYNSGQDAFNVIRSIIKVTNQYIDDNLDTETSDYSKAIDFLKTVNSVYRQKSSNNLSPKSFEQNVF